MSKADILRAANIVVGVEKQADRGEVAMVFFVRLFAGYLDLRDQYIAANGGVDDLGFRYFELKQKS